jgi:capsular exopolysaccharide synthesis family protein
MLEKAVSSSDNIGVLPSGLGVNDPALTSLMTSLNNAQINYEKLKKTVGENHPMLLATKEEINNLRPDILANIQTQKRNLTATQQNLYSTSGKYNSMLNYIPQKEKQLLEISRDQNIKNGIYSFLLQKREESQLSYANNISDSKVVNYALAGRTPVSPKKTFIYLAALLIGLLAPVLLVGAREMLNNKILYRKEIEALTGIPVIGEIVFNKSKDSVVIEPGKRTFIAEEFRKIRVSLLFLGIDSYHKKILVTSSIPGEGKSFVSANLAISLAMTGKKVALVDMDLHNPSLGKMFNVTTEEIGVSDYLLGEKEAADIIRSVPNHENLSFISSGGIHPTPSELLENGQVQKLISYLEENFDVVVMDTAPVVMVTDAYHLSSLADATLYVVRHKYTPKMLVKRIDENNKINTLKNPAIIFNGVKTRGFMKNNYGYGYDYVYGGDQKKYRDNKVKA